MKVTDDKVLTLNDVFEWVKKNNIPFDTPVGVYIGIRELGMPLNGIVLDVRPELDENGYNIYEEITDDVTGMHCYCKNEHPVLDYDVKKMIMLTDGCHYED